MFSSKYIRVAVKQIFRMFSSCTSETIPSKQLSISLPLIRGKHHSISVSVNFTTLDISYKWNHKVFGFFFCDRLITLSIMSSRFIHVGMWQDFLPFEGWITFHCMYRPHLFIHHRYRWTSGLLPPLGYCK